MKDAGYEAFERGEETRRTNQPPSAARDAFAQAVAAFRSAGSPSDLARALTRCAQVERDIRNYDAALQFQQEAVDLYRSCDKTASLAHAIRHYADILVAAGRCEDAAPFYREMLQLYEDSCEVPPLEMANAIRSVALHAELSGDAQQARRFWHDARARYENLGPLFAQLTGSSENRAVKEADRHLATLAASQDGAL